MPSSAFQIPRGQPARGGGLRQTPWSPPTAAPAPGGGHGGAGVSGGSAWVLGEMRDVLEVWHGGEGPAAPSFSPPGEGLRGRDIPYARACAAWWEIQKQRQFLLLWKNFGDICAKRLHVR